jgi:hypothetical protein
VWGGGGGGEGCSAIYEPYEGDAAKVELSVMTFSRQMLVSTTVRAVWR